MRNMRLAAASLAALSLAVIHPAARGQSQTAPAAQAPAAPAGAPGDAAPKADPVVARVGNDEIHLSEVQEASASVPAEYRQVPMQVLFPMLLDQLVDRHAISAMAEKQGLDKDPRVQKSMQRAAQSALQNALMQRDVGPLVTDALIKARYEATVASKAGEPEVHARHILVANEDDAKKIIAELGKGGDFAAIAKARSTDPGSAQGGDLGWFKKGDMLPEFSEVAFALKPGQISQVPVHTRYGWHVIKVEETRTATPPTFEQSRDELRQQIIQEAVQKVVAQAKSGLKVEKFNPDGTVPKATDAATPPAPPGATTDTPPAPPGTMTAPAQ